MASAGALSLSVRTTQAIVEVVLLGSIARVLLFETQGKGASNSGYMRAVSSFDYVASFPVTTGDVECFTYQAVSPWGSRWSSTSALLPFRPTLVGYQARW